MQMPEAHPPPVDGILVSRSSYLPVQIQQHHFLPEVKNNYRSLQFSSFQDSLSSSSYKHLRPPRAQQIMPGTAG